MALSTVVELFATMRWQPAARLCSKLEKKQRGEETTTAGAHGLVSYVRKLLQTLPLNIQSTYMHACMHTWHTYTCCRHDVLSCVIGVLSLEAEAPSQAAPVPAQPNVKATNMSACRRHLALASRRKGCLSL